MCLNTSRQMNKLPYCILNHLYEKHKEGFIGEYIINDFVKTINFSESAIAVALVNLEKSKFITLDKKPIWGSILGDNIPLNYDNYFIHVKITDEGIKYFEKKIKWWNGWFFRVITGTMLAIFSGYVINKMLQEKSKENKPNQEQQRDVKTNQ